MGWATRTGDPRERQENGVGGRQAFESWAKSYLKNFAGPLSTDVRIVAQLVRDAARPQPTSL